MSAWAIEFPEDIKLGIFIFVSLYLVGNGIRVSMECLLMRLQVKQKQGVLRSLTPQATSRQAT